MGLCSATRSGHVTARPVGADRRKLLSQTWVWMSMILIRQEALELLLIEPAIHVFHVEQP